MYTHSYQVHNTDTDIRIKDQGRALRHLISLGQTCSKRNSSSKTEIFLCLKYSSAAGVMLRVVARYLNELDKGIPLRWYASNASFSRLKIYAAMSSALSCLTTFSASVKIVEVPSFTCTR